MQITWKNVLGTGVAGLVVSMSVQQALAACPPEETDGQTRFRVVRPVEPSLADTIVTQPAQTLYWRNTQPLTATSRPLTVQPFRVDYLPAQTTLARPGADVTYYSQPADGARRARVATLARPGDGSDSSSNIVIVKDDDNVSIRIENGKIMSVERNGKKVPLDRVRRDGDNVKIVDEDGKVVFETTIGIDNDDAGTAAIRLGARDGTGLTRLRTLRPGQAGTGTFSFTPGQGGDYAQPGEEPKVMIGIQLADPDRSLTGHFGLEAGQATLVSGVYEDLPAAKAGLEPYDLIVGIDGKESAGQAEVRKTIRGTDEGGTISLSVIHRGKKHDVKVKVMKYDAEKLHNAKVNSVELGLGGFGGVGNDFNRVFVAPGQGFNYTWPQMDQFQKLQDLPPEAREKIHEEMQRALKSGDEARNLLERAGREREIQQEHARNLMERRMRGDEGGADDRLRGIEDRMERLEKMLQKMIDRHEKENQRGSDDAPERHA